MSVRIITHAVAIPGPQIPRRRRWVKYRQPVRRVRLPKPDWVTRFADDRDLAGAKLVLVGLMVLIVMVLEVPW